MGDEATTRLVEELATGVVRAALPRPVVVVTDDAEVVSWAAEMGAEVHFSTVRGLNESVSEARDALKQRFTNIVVAHGDLRNPEGLGIAYFEEGVTIVSDGRGDGSNVLVVPSAIPFTFAYGVGSAARHAQHAQEMGLPWRLHTSSPWSLDIDTADDLA